MMCERGGRSEERGRDGWVGFTYHAWRWSRKSNGGNMVDCESYDAHVDILLAFAKPIR